jgi:hypothetical protein
MRDIPDQSIDMILCDLPYGTTAHVWGSLIPLEPLWVEYKRIIRPNRAIVLTASQPFTTVLAASNLEQLKYEWIWAKNRPTNFAHPKNKPMKKHENVLVFSSGTTVHASQSSDRMPYFPQGVHPLDQPYTHERGPAELTAAFFSGRKSHERFTRTHTGYPSSILEFATDQPAGWGLMPLSRDEGHRNILNNCLGDNYEFKGLRQRVTSVVGPGDKIVIVTDGITGDFKPDLLSPSDLEVAIVGLTAQSAAEQLIEVARPKPLPVCDSASLLYLPRWPV